MTWMVIRLILSLAFVAAVLLFAARLAKKRGLGKGNDLVQIVSRQRLGRTSTVNVVRVADLCLVVGATEEQITLLAEVDPDLVAQALGEAPPPRREVLAAQDEEFDEYDDYEVYEEPHAAAARPSGAALAGSVLDREGWGNLVHELRERTVRRS